MDRKVPLRTIIRNFRQNFVTFQSIVKEHKLDTLSQILIALFTSKMNKDVRCEWEKEIWAKGKFYSFEEFLRSTLQPTSTKTRNQRIDSKRYSTIKNIDDRRYDVLRLLQSKNRSSNPQMSSILEIGILCEKHLRKKATIVRQMLTLKMQFFVLKIYMSLLPKAA